jgi:hypothetical protein
MGKLRHPPGSFGRLKSVSANEWDEPTIEPGRSQDCAGQSVSLAAGQITGKQRQGAVMVMSAPAGKTPPAGVFGLTQKTCFRAVAWMASIGHDDRMARGEGPGKLAPPLAIFA